MNNGDTFTMAGCYKQITNPNRRWWQFWKPRMVQSSELQRFTITDNVTSEGFGG